MYFQVFQHSLIPTLEGPEGKLGRAKRHVEAFKEQVAALEAADHHSIIVEDDPNTSEYVFKVTGLQPTNDDWGYIVGDSIHNLRAVLDHLVYQLAILNHGRDLTEEEARSCTFPVYDDPSKFPNPSKGGPIHLLRLGEQTRITELQPFNAQDPSIWKPAPGYLPTTPAHIPSLLAQLARLDNIDKHRLVHATWRAVSWVDVREPPVPFRRSTTYLGTLEDSAEIGRWRYDLPRPDLPADMNMNSYFPIGITLGDPPHINGAVELLEWMTNAVAVVIEIFRPCITEGLPPLALSLV